MLSLEKTKKYLKVDYDEDDDLILGLINDARNRCISIIRKEEAEVPDTDSVSNFDLACLFAVAYAYEHREEADYGKLNLSLRDLLFNDREAKF